MAHFISPIAYLGNGKERDKIFVDDIEKTALSSSSLLIINVT